MNIGEYALRAGEDRMLYLEKVREFVQTDDICCSDTKVAADLFRDMYQMHHLPEEYVYMAAMDAKLHPIAMFEIAHGTQNGAYVEQKQIVQRALLCGAAAVCLVHNHRRKADDALTTKVYAALKTCGIMLVDHLIIAGAGKHDDYSYMRQSNLSKQTEEK